jgi:tRNA-dihydrouridine synthase
MKLGNYNLVKPVFMAPMAGITDKAFREIIRSVGGKYVFS